MMDRTVLITVLIAEAALLQVVLWVARLASPEVRRARSQRGSVLAAKGPGRPYP
jgi:hypothetical protein